MSERLIVEARGVPMNVALRLAGIVVERGRVSDDGRSYCYASQCVWERGFAMVYAVRNKASDRLVVEAM